MRHLVMVGRHAKVPASYMHPGSLDWATHYPPADQAMPRNLRLWERVDTAQPTLAAWAVFAHNEGSFDLFVHPTLNGTPLHETLMDEYVAWAEARAREVGLKKLWPFWTMDYDKVMERLLTARGFVFVQTGLPAPLFERTLDELPTIPLPDGFTVHAVNNLDDGRLRVRRPTVPSGPRMIGRPTRRRMRTLWALRSTTAGAICLCARPMVAARRHV